MDFWARLVGSTYGPKKPPLKQGTNDPQVRLARFRRVFNTVVELCNRPRNPGNEGPLLQNLHASLQRLVILIREETRAPIPHTVLHFAAVKQIYVAIARAAGVSQHEAIIQAAVAVFAALIDSEEEDFLSSGPFAKSLMRLVTRVVNSGSILIGVETETAILELLFTVSAKIRLQPEILPVWFQSTSISSQVERFTKEKTSFVGLTQKEDFPLCYLLIDRVHHEGRIGDFARTGLLYIFEATGRSEDLEQWVVQSDLSTLMASGLGALYSQLSRELSILHADATLPAILAMSDYSTTHSRATAESAFSERHEAHMATFLSYLAFWQDVLDHCRSSDVKQTLLDHFQILFLQQLLYPSLLQSSDTDGGSSVAVLTYMAAILEALEYPGLIHMILTYLLAITENTIPTRSIAGINAKPSAEQDSQTIIKRRQSLVVLTATKNLDDVVEPVLFNLTDLVMNSISSENSQTVFAALKLSSTIVARQRKYAFGTLLKVEMADYGTTLRTLGASNLELEKYTDLAKDLHDHPGIQTTYAGLCHDIRQSIEAQIPFKTADAGEHFQRDFTSTNQYTLSAQDPLLQALINLLLTFYTNSIDVNLALTQTVISIASCTEVRLDGWLAIDAATCISGEEESVARHWQSSLDDDERLAWSALQRASRRPAWPKDNTPLFFTTLGALLLELASIRDAIPNLDQLLSGRKSMLQAARPDQTPSEPPSSIDSPSGSSSVDFPRQSRGQTKVSSPSRNPKVRGNANTFASPNHADSHNTSVTRAEPTAKGLGSLSPPRPVFQPPPVETPSTTDVLMQKITFPRNERLEQNNVENLKQRSSSLNHVLTNVVLLQEFVLELVAVLQIRTAVLGEYEVRTA
nr:upf0518 protein [Quercus suber]